jgi:glutamate/tyrosine decarboxylase-like PLP-dependent enzyme
MSNPALYPCFLGPYGENDDLLESLLVEFLREHVFWRRNLHPEDPPAIPTGARHAPAYRDFESRLRRELHMLSAALKRSVPFHSPRYIGHMVSDLLIPAFAAQVLALPYNPNNVSAEAAPVTIDLELKAGLQLAAMLGWPHDPARDDCAFGHLTSGGTLANVQGLRLALALKAFPVALRAAAVPLDELPPDDVMAFNLAPAQATALYARWCAALDAMAPAEAARWRHAVDAQRIETLGAVAFHAAHPALRPPRVFAPATAHYSWSKGVKLLGLGAGLLERLPSRSMRLDLDALDERLGQCRRAGDPVLMAVGVLGSTEFGSIDPIDGLVALRDRHAAAGLGFALHVDAAWGGYLASLFRREDGTLRGADEVGREFARFPRPAVHAAIAALSAVDSVTIDPHKLGHVPYGAGAFVCRDQRAMPLLAEDADYVFSPGPARGDDARRQLLGRVIPEGSKPGAMAASVYVTHRVLPLDHANFGRLVAESLRDSEAFVAAAEAFVARIADRACARVPFEPDSNLVCLAINPRGNRGVAGMNRFMRALQARLSADPAQPLQRGEYFGSVTTLGAAALGTAELRALAAGLGIDPADLDPDDPARDRLVVLRHTLMNPFLRDDTNGISYIDGYFAWLERQVDELLASAGIAA